MARQVNDPLRQFGVWAYRAGTSGVIQIGAGKRVVGITAYSSAGGSITINSGDSIPIAAGATVSIAPRGNVVAPSINFDTTASYLVDTVDDSDI